VESLRWGESLTELTGSRPLLLTIEMGLEKLRRDYTHALLATGTGTVPYTNLPLDALVLDIRDLA
jgi:hypothetical protein